MPLCPDTTSSSFSMSTAVTVSGTFRSAKLRAPMIRPIASRNGFARTRPSRWIPATAASGCGRIPAGASFISARTTVSGSAPAARAAATTAPMTSPRTGWRDAPLRAAPASRRSGPPPWHRRRSGRRMRWSPPAAPPGAASPAPRAPAPPRSRRRASAPASASALVVDGDEYHVRGVGVLRGSPVLTARNTPRP